MPTLVIFAKKWRTKGFFLERCAAIKKRGEKEELVFWGIFGCSLAWESWLFFELLLLTCLTHGSRGPFWVLGLFSWLRLFLLVFFWLVSTHVRSKEREPDFFDFSFLHFVNDFALRMLGTIKKLQLSPALFICFPIVRRIATSRNAGNGRCSLYNFPRA